MDNTSSTTMRERAIIRRLIRHTLIMICVNWKFMVRFHYLMKNVFRILLRYMERKVMNKVSVFLICFPYICEHYVIHY